MVLPIITAAAVFALLSLPGWILAGDRVRPLWVHVAAGFCSQFAVIITMASIALVVPGQVDVRVTLLLAAALSGLALWWRRGSVWYWPSRPDGWIFLVPLVASIAAALITASAIGSGADGLKVHAWFNADGFKHLGHVQSLAVLGLPAEDIFEAGAPLSYYWFFYVIPAIGVALHGDAAMGLIASGLVQTVFFWVLVQGLLRMAGANARWSAIIALLAWLSPTPDGVLGLASAGWDISLAAREINIEGIGGALLNAFPLFRVSLYVPQHQFMLVGLMSWAVLSITTQTRALRWLAVVPLVCAGAVSTLLGVSCLAVFAVTRLVDREQGLGRRLGGIGVVGGLALAVPLVFGIVDAAGGSGLDSPIFAGEPVMKPVAERLALAVAGLILAYGVYLVGMFGLVRGFARRDLEVEARRTLIFAAAMVGVGIAIMLASTLLDNTRLALEIQLRTSLLPYLGLSIGAVWLLSGAAKGRQRLAEPWGAVMVPMLVLGMVTPALDWAWHGVSSARWVVQVPPDDLAVLDALRRQSGTQIIVLQYPELPFVSAGRGIWAPLFAARMVFASHRSTHWGEQVEKMQQTLLFFEGTGPLPDGQYDVVYLSRTLHPQSYDLLMAKMAGSPGWSKGPCRPDACLWLTDQDVSRSAR
jgi:hypothetical protein